MNESEIRALARLVDRMDYYRLLRVDRSAPAPEVRAAYHDARRRFHPDTFFRAPDDVRTAVDRIAKRITEAYTVLRDVARRSSYDSALERGALRFDSEAQETLRQRTEEKTGATPNGRRFYALSIEEERKGDIPRAIAQLKMAITFERDNPSFDARLRALSARQRE